MAVKLCETKKKLNTIAPTNSVIKAFKIITDPQNYSKTQYKSAIQTLRGFLNKVSLKESIKYKVSRRKINDAWDAFLKNAITREQVKLLKDALDGIAVISSKETINEDYYEDEDDDDSDDWYAEDEDNGPVDAHDDYDSYNDYNAYSSSDSEYGDYSEKDSNYSDIDEKNFDEYTEEDWDKVEEKEETEAKDELEKLFKNTKIGKETIEDDNFNVDKFFDKEYEDYIDSKDKVISKDLTDEFIKKAEDESEAEDEDIDDEENT